MPTGDRLPVLKPLIAVRPDLTTACCVAQCALSTGVLPSDRTVRRTCLQLARAWVGGRRRLPWVTVSEHLEELQPLREVLRLVDLVDAVASPGAVPTPRANKEGRTLHSIRDIPSMVAALFKHSKRVALVWECKPCAIMIRLDDGVWAAKAKHGTKTCTLQFVKITSVAKGAHFIGAPAATASYPCNILELR